MGFLPAFIHPDRADTPEVRHYQKLLDHSLEARQRGDHWTAQRLASAAHNWAMKEMMRLQYLAHEQDLLAAARKRLDTAWDNHRGCTTVEELQEAHPEYRRLVVAWQAAEQRVRDLSDPTLPDDALLDPALADRPVARRTSFRPTTTRRFNARGVGADNPGARDGETANP